MMSSIGFSSASLAGATLREALSVGLELGMTSVEILGFEGERHSQGDLCGFAFAERCEEDESWLQDALDPFGRISVHAPFIQTPLLTNNAGIAREAQRQVLACIRGIARMGGHTCTIHLNAVPFSQPAEWQKQALTVLRELAETAAACGVVLAVETGFPAEEEAYCSIIENADHPAVGACIDTGHIMHYYPAALRGTEKGIAAHNDILNRLVTRLGPRVALFHCHDNRTHDFRDHRTPGHGIIDWPRLMQTLETIDFSGSLVLELEEVDGPAALKDGQQHLLDALENAQTEESLQRH